MNNVRILTIGRLREPYLAEAQKEYLKRLKPYLNLDVFELNDFPCPDNASPAEEEQVRQREGLQIMKSIRPKSYLVTLDRRGNEMSSPELAKFIQERMNGAEPLVFVIGGSLGLSEEVIKSAQLSWSFSKLTFPHQLFRVMLLEQIYRACKINRNEPYHK